MDASLGETKEGRRTEDVSFANAFELTRSFPDAIGHRKRPSDVETDLKLYDVSSIVGEKFQGAEGRREGRS